MGGIFFEGLGANFEAGEDDTATEDTAVVDEVDSDSGAEVGDDDGLFSYGVSGGGGDDSVGADFAGLIDGEVYRVRDVLWYHVDFFVEVFFNELLDDFCPCGLDGADDDDAITFFFLGGFEDGYFLPG